MNINKISRFKGTNYFIFLICNVYLDYIYTSVQVVRLSIIYEVRTI